MVVMATRPETLAAVSAPAGSDLLWCKRVNGLDTRQAGGYKFLGDWLSWKHGPPEVPVGTVIVWATGPKTNASMFAGVVLEYGAIKTLCGPFAFDHAKWADRVLASPAFKEAWGNHSTSQTWQEQVRDVIAPAVNGTPSTATKVGDNSAPWEALETMLAPQPPPEPAPEPVAEEVKVPAEPIVPPAPPPGPPQHKELGRLVMLAKARLNIWLAGPAGCGKTFLAKQVARELDLPFFGPVIGSEITDVGDVTGRNRLVNGTQVYVPSAIVATLQSPMGGVCLVDEITQVCEPSLLGPFNSVFEGNELYVPALGEMVHAVNPENIVWIAAANTFGRGADSDYCGNIRIDGATLDRFAGSMVAVDYDQELERSLYDRGIAQMVQAARQTCRERKIKRIVSMRITRNLTALLRAGASYELLVQQFFCGWSEDDQRTVEPSMVRALEQHRD